MKKFVKIITLSIVILIAVSALGIVALVTLVDPNSYKSLIIKTVNDNTGRKLTLDGDITWKLWPKLGLHIEKVSLSNPSDFSTPNLVSLNSADVSVEIMPLLHHSIIINSITLDGLNLDLIKNGSLNNWTFKQDNESDINISESSQTSGLNLQLSKFNITHSTITYNDLKGTSHYKIDDFDLDIKTKIGGIISFNSESEIIKIKDAEFDFSNALKGKLDYDLNGFTTPKYNGKIDLDIVSMGKFMRKLNTANPDFDKPLFNNISLNSSFSGDSSNINIDNTSFKFASLLQGTMNINIMNLSKPDYNGNINIPTFSLNEVLKAGGMKPIDIPNKNLLNQVSFKSAFVGTTTSINLNKLVAKISDTNINGSINATSIQPLKLNQDLNIDKFELSNIVDTKGFQVLLSEIHSKGEAMINKNINSLDAKQQLTIKDIIISGFNLDSFLSQIDDTLSTSGNLTTGTNSEKLKNALDITNTIKKMQAIVNKATAPGAKNLSEKTNLGSLNANIVINNGVINPASYKLSGPSILNTGNGQINLNNKTMKYSVDTKILKPLKNTILNQITFGYSLNGNMNNLDGSLDWVSIQKQLVEYIVKTNSQQVKSLIKNQVGSAINNQISPAANIKKGVTGVLNSIFK